MFIDNPWYDDQGKDVGGEDMLNDDNPIADSIQLPDFSPDKFNKLWDLINNELDKLGRNEFKTPLTGRTGQVGLRVEPGHKDMLKWYGREVVTEPGKNWSSKILN